MERLPRPAPVTTEARPKSGAGSTGAREPARGRLPEGARQPPPLACRGGPYCVEEIGAVGPAGAPCAQPRAPHPSMIARRPMSLTFWLIPDRRMFHRSKSGGFTPP